jgi:hypothetical protein
MIWRRASSLLETRIKADPSTPSGWRAKDGTAGASPMFEELLGREVHTTDDLAEKKRRDVPPAVNRDRRAPTVGVPELLVRPPLPDLLEPKPTQNRDDLARSETGIRPTDQADTV